ncbi:methyltransferase domain-containing protein [Paenibacillus gansuensis]|uniref:Methyltransferase domain-containing protein n=1 Tax=Paenibacillus gansuensis TaxID=306542 RepID=A0ABW5PFI2_9BACL
MFSFLRKRSLEPEYMDDFSEGGVALLEALRHLRRLNRVFGAAGPTMYGVRRLWKLAGKPCRLSILDIGAGSGDVNKRLLKWADRHGIQMSITLVDITWEACAEARELYAGEDRVKIRRADLFQLAEQAEEEAWACADIVTASQFVHHFDEEQLPRVIDAMLSCSRYGVVVNDIHRHWVSWGAVWLMTRLLSKNDYIRHDGPLSVAKGFRSADWKKLKNAMPSARMQYSWRPLFRYCLIARPWRPR